MKMESKNELLETDIKNPTCYYFDDIIKAIDIIYIKKTTKIFITFDTILHEYKIIAY